jgi:hypothetical protein
MIWSKSLHVWYNHEPCLWVHRVARKYINTLVHQYSSVLECLPIISSCLLKKNLTMSTCLQLFSCVTPNVQVSISSQTVTHPKLCTPLEP